MTPMTPDEHAEEARRCLSQAEETVLGTDRCRALAQLATAHALLAQRPETVTLVHETTSTDEMAMFTEVQGLDDIRDWHAEAAQKADRLDDFDAWLHVRDVGKLLDHIDHQDHIVRRGDEVRERLRAKAGEATQQALQYKAALCRLAAEARSRTGPAAPEALQRALTEAEALLDGEAVPSTDEQPDCGHSYILAQFDKAHDALDALGVVPSSEDASVDERIEALAQRTELAVPVPSTGEDTLGGLCPSCGGAQSDHVDNVTEGDHGEDINGWLCLMDELDQVLFDMETAEPPAEPGWLQIVAAVRDAYRHRLASGAVPSTGEDQEPATTSNLARRARRELELCGQYAEDPKYSESIIAAVEAFASFGHSGGSAMVAREQLHKLLGFGTLSPLTSDPDEWIDQSEVSGTPMWQSRRNPAVFSSDGGKTWWHLDDDKPTPAGEDTPNLTDAQFRAQERKRHEEARSDG